jgi:hypothetical protein
MTEQEQKVQQVKNVIEQLENKNFSIYFFTLDTKGNPTAGIANIYEHVKVLNELGYNAKILHEKNDYKLRGDESSMGIADWLGEEYAALPHVSIEGQNLNISPADFIVIPEIFSTVMDQIKAFPCRKIVLSQSYDYLLELLPIGKRWDIDYGFNHVITTSERQSNYIKTLFPSVRTHVVPVSIPEYFKPSEKPKIPVVSISTRNHGDAAKIAKSFYLQYPMYKWVTFKELRGLTRKEFAEELGKSCLGIWIDDSSGFGTFPLEAMHSNTPVIGKIPNMVPEWMEAIDEQGNPIIKNNGVWTNTTLNLPELIATYMKVWLEDSLPEDLMASIKESSTIYTTERQKLIIQNVYGQLVHERKEEFNNILKVQNNQETVKQ